MNPRPDPRQDGGDNSSPPIDLATGSAAAGSRSATRSKRSGTGDLDALLDIEPARKLFARVIEVALEDQRYLEEAREKPELSPRDTRRLRIIADAVPPEEFFNSDWFEHVCELVGIHPQAVRDRL